MAGIESSPNQQSALGGMPFDDDSLEYLPNAEDARDESRASVDRPVWQPAHNRAGRQQERRPVEQAGYL